MTIDFLASLRSSAVYPSSVAHFQRAYRFKEAATSKAQLTASPLRRRAGLEWPLTKAQIAAEWS